MTVYLGLGANRDARPRLEQALRELPRFGVRILRVSRFRRTRPVAATGRGPFLNAVAEAETALLPQVLLGRLQLVERRCGRRRRGLKHGRNVPRSCDLDLLLYGRYRIGGARLRVPHPRLAGRRFVLDGLAELAPGGHAPGSGVSFRSLRARAPR